MRQPASSASVHLWPSVLGICDMTSGAKRALLVMTVVGLSMGAAGCRDDEQGRPMVKEKGVYEGPADEKLDEDSLSDLRSRAAGQKF